MVSSKKMRGLIGYDDAVVLCVWQVAEDYVEYGGKIVPLPAAGYPRFTMTKPLADPNLFLTFSNLGAQGDDLPKDAILRWVRKYGLLRLKDANEDPRRNENQEPITFDEFRREARHAREAMTLLEAIHSKDYDALRARITLQDDSFRPGEGSADMYLDGRQIPMSTSARELPDHTVLIAGQVGLQWFVKMRLSGATLDFDPFTGHPRPEEVYRPKLVYMLPDLFAAIWFQFASLMCDTRPVKYCEVCESPIFHPNRRRKTCSDACRQEKLRREKSRLLAAEIEVE